MGWRSPGEGLRGPSITALICSLTREKRRWPEATGMHRTAAILASRAERADAASDHEFSRCLIVMTSAARSSLTLRIHAAFELAARQR